MLRDELPRAARRAMIEKRSLLTRGEEGPSKASPRALSAECSAMRHAWKRYGRTGSGGEQRSARCHLGRHGADPVPRTLNEVNSVGTNRNC